MIRASDVIGRLLVVAAWIVTGASVAAQGASAGPVRETRPVFDDAAGGRSDADAPAIWVNAANPRHSVVIGTLKRGGLDVYDLKGKLLQHIPGDAGPQNMSLRKARYNNVDLVYGFKSGEAKMDLAVVTDRHNDILRFFAIDPEAVEKRRPPLKEITAIDVPRVFAGNAEDLEGGRTAYGLAVTQTDPSQEVAYAFVSRSGRTAIAAVKVFSDRGRVSYRVLERFDLPHSFSLPDGTAWTPCQDRDGDLPQVEGMVVDDFHGVLYLAQERVGLWKTTIQDPSSNLVLVDRVKGFGIPYERRLEASGKKYACAPKWQEAVASPGDHPTPDLEGLTVYDRGKGQGYLLGSSQGTSEFVVYDRATGAYIGKFTIPEDVVDGSEHCDGAHVVSHDLGGEFSSGLLVVHDGENTPEVRDQNGAVRDNTNFKYVRWSDVARQLGLGSGREY
jgi:3-phytase